jgi:salicylate hydroxylase
VSELTEVDLPDHLFWALNGQPERMGLAPRTRYHDATILAQVAGDVTRSWHADLRRLVARTAPETLSSVVLHAALPVEPWPSTRVTLLGDAIHTMPPLQGMAGNTALRDAALLRDKLLAVKQGQAELTSAIGAYESAMRRYGFAAVQRSRHITEQIASTSALGQLAFKSVLPLADHVGPLRRRLFGEDAS